MLPKLLYAFLLLLQYGAAQNSILDSLQAPTKVTTSQCDAEDRCQCSVQPPDPCAADLEYSELLRAKRQLDRVFSVLNGSLVEDIRLKVGNLIGRIGVLEVSLHNQSISVSMNELSYLQDQVTKIQGTLAQLNLSTNNTVTLQLKAEVDSIQRALLHLATKNPIAVKAELDEEIVGLRARLESCTAVAAVHGDENLKFIGDGLPFNHTFDPRVCKASRNITVGSPITYKFRPNINGLMFKDPLPRNEVEKRRIYELQYASANPQRLRYWPNLDDYERTDFWTYSAESTCTFSADGTKVLVVGGMFYYWDPRTSAKIFRRDMLNDSTCRLTEVSSPYSLSNNAFDSLSNVYTDVDLNIDETGMYAVFADENGELTIIKFNPHTLIQEKRWNTGKQKRTIANLFMVCGRMYTTSDFRGRHLRGKQWGYDTDTSEEFFYDVDVESLYGSIQALSYNPRERVLFGWDNSHSVVYPVFI